MPSISALLREADEQTFSTTVVNVGVASGSFLASSTTRICFAVFPSTVSFVFDTAAPAVTTTGIFVANGVAPFPPLIFHIRDFGTWIRASFRAISLAGAVDVTVFELFSTIT